MASVFRSLRASLPLAKAAVKPSTAVKPMQMRSFTLSAVRSAGAGPPQLLGPGSQPGKVPTDEEQATGLERFELLGKMAGVDVFDMKPIEMERMGTMDEPIPIYSLFPERHVGCTGYPADSHDTIWMTVDHRMKNHRCPECGCVYTLNFQGDPHLLEDGHGHHH